MTDDNKLDEIIELLQRIARALEGPGAKPAARRPVAAGRRMTSTEVAAAMGVDVKTLHRIRLRGLIGYELGGSAKKPRVYYTAEHLAAYRAQQSRGPARR